MRTIDNLTDSKKQLLIQSSKWQNDLIAESITTWPCYNVIADLTHLEKLNKYCAGCAKPLVDARLILYGQPYNNTTLEGCTPHPRIANIKVSFYLLYRVSQEQMNFFRVGLAYDELSYKPNLQCGISLCSNVMAKSLFFPTNRECPPSAMSVSLLLLL